MRRKIPRIIVMGVLTSSMFVLGAGVNSQSTKNVVDARVRNMEADNVTTGSAIVLPLVKEQTVTEKKKKKKCITGWTTTSVNVRKGPSTDSHILETYSFNKKVKYVKHNEKWVEIKYKNSVAYISRNYISKSKRRYKEFGVPKTSGFKSYMSYKCITSTSSPQYKLQKNEAYTGKYGIRQVYGRYCVAIGSHFTDKIGTLFDLVLENGTIIPCILADQKADEDTDSRNIVTKHNGCLSEFVIDSNTLNRSARQHGDISYCTKEWNSPVESIRIYE